MADQINCFAEIAVLLLMFSFAADSPSTFIGGVERRGLVIGIRRDSSSETERVASLVSLKTARAKEATLR